MARVKIQLRELAQERGLTLSQVARRSGLTLGMVRRYWYNQTGEVQLQALGILAELLGVSPGELLKSEAEVDVPLGSASERN